MALVLKDRVKETSVSTGTGDFVLDGAVGAYQDFTAIGDGNVTYYTIASQSTNEWEVGYGTYTLSTNSISRDFIYSSSNSNNIVTFTAGTKDVFCTYPAEQAVYQETNGSLRIIDGVIEVSEDGTTGTTLPNTSFQAFATGNYYMQANQQNLSSGASASADWVITANNGNDTENYSDLGMASSGYNYPDFSAIKANSTYLLGTGADIRIIAGKYGAVTPGAQDVVFIAGSTLDTEERMRLKGATGNLILNNAANPTDTGEKLQVTGSAKITGAAAFGSTVTLNSNPTLALQAATKQYVDDAVSSGIHIHQQVYAETSAALAAAYTQGGTTDTITDITGTDTVTFATATPSVNDEIWLYILAGNGLSINTGYFVESIVSPGVVKLSLTPGGTAITGLTNATGLSYAVRINSGVGAYLESSANATFTISGVTGLTTGQRILVYQQLDSTWNGVYTITSMGSGASKWKLTRATDQDQYAPQDVNGMGAGDYFFVTTNSESYVMTTEGVIIIGYTSITYTLFSASTAYTGTAPIDVTGSVISLGTVGVANGGTGLTTYTAGDLVYSNATNTLTNLSIGSNGQTLIVSGGAPIWGALDLSGSGVSSVLPEVHGGTNQSSYVTGDLLYGLGANTLGKLAPNTTTTKKFLSETGTGSAGQAPTWEVITASDIISGVLAAANGGTGFGTYAVGDLLYADGTSSLAKLPDVATGNALISGGLTTAPLWGKIGLTTHVSGTLPIANGGTNATTASDARTNLDVPSITGGGASGTWNISITGSAGSFAGIVAIANGGTGATNVADAQTNLQVDPAGTAVAMAIALG